MTGTVAGGTSTTVAKDTKLNGPSVSIASGAVVLMTKAARVGIVGNESCAGLASILDCARKFSTSSIPGASRSDSHRPNLGWALGGTVSLLVARWRKAFLLHP